MEEGKIQVGCFGLQSSPLLCYNNCHQCVTLEQSITRKASLYTALKVSSVAGYATLSTHVLIVFCI